MTDYYNTLGLEKTATEQEIKSAYRRLAMQHHPDKGGDINKFQEISEAYETLSNADKRSAYDNPSSQYNQNYNYSGMPPEFSDIFGVNSPFGHIFGSRQRVATNSNIQFSTSITLEEAFTGKEIVANVTLPGGRSQTINIKIPPGIHNGVTLRLAEMGDDSIPNIPKGDILLTIHIEPHPEFHRSGDDLIKEIEVSCISAMLGETVEITTIDQKSLQTEIPAGTQHDTVFGLAGCGMPNFNSPQRRGRLLLKIKIKIPVLTEEQQIALKNIDI